LIALLWLVLAGCAPRSYQMADVVIDDAHGGAHTLSISPDTRLVASGSWAGRIGIWDLPDGDRLRTWQAHDGNINGLTFVSNDRLLSAGHDRGIVEWTSTGQRLRQVKAASPVTAMTVDVSRQLVLTGHADGGVRLRPLSDLSAASTLGFHKGAIRAVALSPKDNQFASSATDGKVRTWQPDGRFIQLPDPGSDARTLVFSPDGTQLYGAGWFDLYRWDLQNRLLTSVDTEHNGIINSILFHPDGKRLASISRQTDSSVLFMNPDSGETVQRFQPHKLCGGVVAISPDAQIMATTSDDASVMIWRLQDVRSPPEDVSRPGSRTGR
jgi:WD40 repeat protein